MKCLGFFILVLGLAGCATSTQQVDTFLLKNHSIPNSMAIDNVPFIQQSAGFCGPAALTMVLLAQGKTVSVEDIAPQVFTPLSKGTFQTDLISASRRQGMLALPVEGLENLLSEIAAGHPVIVFENLALSWLPQWHYAVVFGYDLSNQTVLMHSGPEAFKKWDLRKFERSWKLGNYWGLVIVPPGSLSATSSELSHVKAAAALEELGKLNEADVSYRRILQTWPNSLVAGIGAANIAAKKNFPLEAFQFLETTSRAHPESAVVWHNLAFAQSTLHKTLDARKSAQKAIQLASPDEKLIYSKNLKSLLD